VSGHLDPQTKVVFTRHADRRLRERFPGCGLDEARDDIFLAILSRRSEHRARNIWYAYTAGRERVYPLADCGDRLVVLTVLSPLTEAA
jgi:hypothetical protein